MLNKLTNKIYYMEHSPKTCRPVLGLVVGDNECLVIDGGISLAHVQEFRELIADTQVDIPDIKNIAVTHHHFDHAFGIAAWKEYFSKDINVISSEKCHELLGVYAELDYGDDAMERVVESGEIPRFVVNCIKEEMPDRTNYAQKNTDETFTGKRIIDLGKVTCELIEIPSSHTDGCIIIHVIEEKVVFLGDCLYSSQTHGRVNYNKEKVLGMIEGIKKTNAEYYVFSHDALFDKGSVKSRNDMQKIFNLFTSITDILGTNDTKNIVIEKFTNKYNRQPNREEMFLIRCFLTV